MTRTRTISVLFILGLLSGPGCSSSPAQAEESAPQAEAANTPAAQATWVEAATIERSSAQLDLSVPGEVEGSRESLLASSQGGYVEHADVEVGDRVSKGQALFRIDRGLYQARLAQIEAEVRAARRELARAEKLGQTIAAAEVDAARDRLVSARASIKVAQIQVARAMIRAPFEGVIATVDLEEGEVAGPGTPAARLVQLDPAKVTLSVADRDVGSLRAGAEVHVSTDALAEARLGTIERIHPAADLETRAFTVDVTVPNSDSALLPGMIARVRIERELENDSIIIPQGFLVTKRDANGVFVVEDGIARWRPLRLGSMVRDQVVVEEGLSVGDNIVVVGQRALADGDSVILSRQGRCCSDGRPTFGS